VPATRLGPALGRQRDRAGVGAGQAASAAGIGPDELHAVEAGEQVPDAGTVARLLDHYGSTVDEWLPPRRPMDAEAIAGRSDAATLRRYLRHVEAARGPGGPGGFRHADLQVLVGIVGFDPATIVQRIRSLTGCSATKAKRLRRMLLVGLAVSSGVGLGQGVAAAGQAPPVGPAVPQPAAAPAPPVPAVPIPIPVPATEGLPVVTAVPVGAVAPASAGATAVTFTIPPTVGVRVDGAGVPVAVRTNTAVAPARTDSWRLSRPGEPGGTAPDDAALVERTLALVAAQPDLPAPGDWRPGTWYDLA
jgi:hypothetical protein